MSRIDEALRQSIRTEQPIEDRFDHLTEELRPDAVESSMLDRFVIEGIAMPPSVPQPAPVFKTGEPPEPVSPPLKIPAGLETKLVAGQNVSALTVEQYRRLAAILHDLQAEHGLKTIMVTSAVPAEGKTLTVSNLALTLSESYHQRVLLIDADLRRPSVHTVFGISNSAGLSELVAAGTTSMPVVQLSRYLSVLTAGRQVASLLAMLTSERMRTVVDHAAARFDWVLLDTPPVGLLPDAQLVARLTQGVLLVIGAGSTPYSLVQRAIAEVGPERVIGSVLNRVHNSSLSVDESYGGYYSRYLTDGAGQP
jgi:capsular exopolysaccharide synthesis family protein